MRKHLWKGACAAALLATTGASAQVLINEVDADQAGTDTAEFVELYNAGGAAVDLGAGGYVLVLYNGNAANDASYASYGLTGVIAAGGYYVIGNVSGAALPLTSLENGQDAVALYSGTSTAAFPNGTAATAAGIVDAVVYDTADADDAALIAILTPGQPQIDEATPNTNSIQRIPDGQGGALNTSSYVPLPPTPGAANSAPASPAITLNVTQVNYGRFNATNVGAPAQRIVRITNSGGGTLNVATFGLQAGSNAVFSAGTPSVALPASLTAGQNVEITFSYENSVNATATFTGNVEYVTDAPSSGSGTIPITAEHVQVLQTGTAGQVLINELSYDPAPPSPNPVQDYNNDATASTTDDEFVELFNTTASAINIQGWTVTKQLPTAGTYIFPAGTSLPAGGHLVVFGGGTPTGFGVGPIGPAVTGSFGGLTNGGAEIRVTDGTTIIDAVAYGDQEGVTVGTTAIGLTSDGGSVGRTTDGAATWREFAFDGATAADQPNPAESNGAAPSSVDLWLMFQ